MEDEKLEDTASPDEEVTENSETEGEDYEERIKTLEHELAVSRADFYNFRQRTIKERQETRKHAQEDVITEFLPVLDNLDRALEAASSEDTQSIIKGVDMVRRQFINALENLGVTIIEAQGEEFNPAIHDAVNTEQVEDPELDGKIIAERLKGYRTKDKVLRPAQVTVGKI
ncbi:MAG: nucleotide exchange factor GrpE [Synergistaceae bacterium]|nr:nucleotide exchange factor GrpE [Synergistaceae bacterium]